MLNQWLGRFKLADCGGNRITFGLLLDPLTIESSKLRSIFLGLLGQKLSLHCNQICARAFGRLKYRLRIGFVAERRPQSRNVQLRSNKIASDVLLFGCGHCRIELNQNVTRLDALAIAHVDGAHDAGLEWLYQLDPTARDDLAGGGRDDIDMPESRPDQGKTE